MDKEAKAALIVGSIAMILINTPCFIYIYQGCQGKSSDLYWFVGLIQMINITLGVSIIIHGLIKLYEYLSK